jgi:hypothetical protein
MGKEGPRIMRALVNPIPRRTRWRLGWGSRRIDTTLLELIETIAEDTDDDREIVATVLRMLRAGRVRLIGNFRDQRVDAA